MEFDFKSARRLPLAAAGLTAVNMIVFLVLELLGSTEDSYFMFTHGALYGPAVLQGGEYYRLFTSMFLHFGAAHLMNNMLMLYLIGERLERVLGTGKTLMLYLVSGVGANVFTLWFYELMHTDAISAGASGALMGMIGGLFACVVKRRGRLAGMDRRQMLVLIVFSLYSGFVSSSTNNAAHISGMFFGFLLGLILYRGPKHVENGEFL